MNAFLEWIKKELLQDAAEFKFATEALWEEIEIKE